MRPLCFLVAALGADPHPSPTRRSSDLWTTGQPLIVTQTVNGHTSVGLTAYLGDGGTHSGDWARLRSEADTSEHHSPIALAAPPPPAPTCSPNGNYRILILHGDPGTPPT